MNARVFVLATAALAAAVALVLLLPADPVDAKDPDLTALKKALARAQAANDIDAMRDALEKIAELEDSKGPKLVLDFAIAAGPRAHHDVARRALERTTSEKAIADLAKVLESPKGPYEPRVVIAEAFRKIEGHDDAIVPALCAALKDQNVTVRREAATSLGKKQDRRAVTALIDLYAETEGDKGRVFMAARRSLVDLTGEAYAKGEEWKAFWEGKKDSYDFEKDRGKGDEGATAVRRAEFFGQQIESSAVVVVVDVSGSMEMWDANAEFPEEKYKDTKPPKERVRMDRVKAELARVVDALSKETRFNVVTFSGVLKRWQTKLVPADDRNKAGAKQFVAGLRADGGTYTDIALKDAFAYADADLVILCSDGAPMKYAEDRQDAKYRDQILGDVEKWNRYRRVRIDCLGFDGFGVWPKHLGPRPDSLKEDKTKEFIKFMVDLADQNNGTYKPIP